MYQHVCQATHKFLLHLKLYQDSTLPCYRWHIQMNSSQMLRTTTQRCQQAHSYRLPSALSHPESRRQVVHGPTALKNTSATKLKHYGKLENMYESRHMVNSCTSWKTFFTFPTRDASNDENAWIAHKHEQDPLLRASLHGNGNHGTLLRWAATWYEDTKEQELHQAWTMKTHKTVILSQILPTANRKYLEWL